MEHKRHRRLSSQAMAFVLAGGRGSRLKELTDRRAKPAVYFGGKTRIVDFALSNALNSGIRKMAITSTRWTTRSCSSIRSIRVPT
jgi:glucose-1-phosphate adenylyltransferase